MDQALSPVISPCSSRPPHEPHQVFLSESGASAILSFANPRTVCALASLNKTFLAASISDIIWTRMLAASCFRALSCADEDDRPPMDSPCSKRELYFRLCRSISLRGGTQKYWLDRATGGDCYMLSAKGLAIAWGTSPECWEWIPCSGSWFSEVAFLQNVCWLYVQGTFREALKPGTYMVSFRMQLRSEDLPMWHRTPIKLSLRSTSDGHQVDSQRFFDRQFPESEAPVFSPQNGDPLPARSKWVDCDVGLFTVEQGDENGVEVTFSMQETELLGWKRGLFLDGVLVKPWNVISQPRERAEAILTNHELDVEEGEVVECDFSTSREGRIARAEAILTNHELDAEEDDAENVEVYEIENEDDESQGSVEEEDVHDAHESSGG